LEVSFSYGEIIHLCLDTVPKLVRSNVTSYREAKEEKQIQDPKSTLHAMRKNASYFESKLRLLHKLNGLHSLQSEYFPNDKSRDWFRGYYTFSNQATVRKLFRRGKPLSCFCLDENHHELHVAVLGGDDIPIEERLESSIYYLTFTYDTNKNFTSETGMHFCQFKLQEGVRCGEKAKMKISDFAIMLPYIRDTEYIEQYTLIYSDWEVLICGGKDQRPKGQTPICERLFESVMNFRSRG